jgi:putative transposase
MPRTKIPAQSDFPYHISGRCINKEWFNLPMSTVWSIMSDELRFANYAYGVKIHSFVLMTNHFHLLLSTPEANLSLAMWNFMGKSSRFLTKAGNRINQTYGSRHFRTVVKGYHYFTHAYKYVYANPVKAGLCERAELYPYSTLNGLIGLNRLTIPLEEDTLLFGNVEKTLEWLNKKTDDEDWQKIKTAMKKKEFKIAKDKNSKKANHLEIDML